jgi:lysophospholipase L1-like esterase
VKNSVRSVYSGFVALLFAVLSLSAFAQRPQPVVHAQPAEQPNSPTIPSDKLQTPKWAERHQLILDEIKRSNPELVFLGDSITQNWEKKGDTPETDYQRVWQRYYGERHAINLGVSGDTTGNVLWRIQNGELDGISPKVVVLLIGTNNTGRTRFWPADQTTEGIRLIIESIHQKLPTTKVLVLGILPKDSAPEKIATDAAVNGNLKKMYSQSPFVTYFDAGSVLMKDGHVDDSLFADPKAIPPRSSLHPTAIGQEKVAAAIEPVLSKMLGESEAQATKK